MPGELKFIGVPKFYSTNFNIQLFIHRISIYITYNICMFVLLSLMESCTGYCYCLCTSGVLGTINCKTGR